MVLINNYLKKLAIFSSTPQVNKKIEARDAGDYLSEMGYSKIGWRALRRNFVYLISGQKKYHIDSLELMGKHVAWVYFGENQIGDSLMDLAPRSLLKDHGYTVDLITTEKIASLYKYDSWFNDVVTECDESLGKYDFAIVISKNYRSLKYKIKHLKNLPWVSILESFAGPDFNRASYATQRILDLMNLNINSASFAYHACQKLSSNFSVNYEYIDINKSKEVIALCIGGIDDLRIYKKWIQLIKSLSNNGMHEFILIGSENGSDIAASITQENFDNTFIYDYVGKLSLFECRNIFSISKLVVCSDGGLMHLAVTTSTPIISFFSSAIHPKWRLPSRENIISLSSQTEDVNDIPLDLIVNSVVELTRS